MDPRQLFADEDMAGACVYCGGAPDTRDHVPSRILLDEPFPDNLPIADCCESCNNGFSLDEEYVACFIDCVISGSTSPDDVNRSKVARILAATPSLAARISQSETRDANGQQNWKPEIDRVNNVVLKLARGHVAFELSLLQIGEPLSIRCAPIFAMDDDAVRRFLSAQEKPLWPEIGSRRFIRACRQFPHSGTDLWQVIQPGRYQYLVSQADGLLVRILLCDYLACEVHWD